MQTHFKRTIKKLHFLKKTLILEMEFNLTSLGKKYNTDKATYHNFTDIYETYFHILKNNPLNILEIGIFNGGSLRMLKEYFFNSNIYGIDFDIKKCFTEDRIHTICGDQTNKVFLQNIFSNISFDIVIDDGGHTMDQQQISFEILFPRVVSKGIYIIEDLHTSYEYGYKQTRSDTTTLTLLENIQKGKDVSKSFYIQNTQFINDIAECKIYYTNNNTSVTSVIIKK